MHTSQKASLSLATLAALGLAATTAAPAAPTVYTNRGNFNSALGTAAATAFFNNFSTIPASPPNNPGFPNVAPTASYSGGGGPYSYTASIAPSPASTDPNQGSIYRDGSVIGTSVNSDNLKFTFSPNVYAFGGDFFTTDVNGTPDPGQTIIFSFGDGSSDTFTSSSDISDTGSFRGYVFSAPISSFVFVPSEPDAPRYATIDNLTVAGRPQLNAVPEPSSVAAFALTGLFAAGLILKARKRQSAS